MAEAQQSLAAKALQDRVEYFGGLAKSRDPLVADWAIEQLSDLDTPQASQELREIVRVGHKAQRLLYVRGKR